MSIILIAACLLLSGSPSTMADQDLASQFQPYTHLKHEMQFTAAAAKWLRKHAATLAQREPVAEDPCDLVSGVLKCGTIISGGFRSKDPKALHKHWETELKQFKDFTSYGLSAHKVESQWVFLLIATTKQNIGELNQAQLLADLNQFRKKELGKKAGKKVVRSNCLAKMAAYWAKFLKNNDLDVDKYAHRWQNNSLETRAKKFKCTHKEMSENVARLVSAQGAVAKWATSPGHRENMLDPMTHIGASCIDAPSKRKPSTGKYICVLVMAKK